MNTNAVVRLAAPLLIAAALVLSRRPEASAPPPVELQPGQAQAPPAAVVLGAFDAALAPGAPGYDRGTSRASVTVLEFADFGCRYCARFALETYPALAEEFVRTGRVRWKYVPFVLGMFPNGDGAARAAECSADQGRAAFGRMHDVLYQRQGEWTSSGDAPGVFRAYAASAGLDAARFASCYEGTGPDARIRASNELADRMGVRATPTFFVNGNLVEGALPLEQFRAVIEGALRAGPSQ